jgi:hypothetical protein
MKARLLGLPGKTLPFYVALDVPHAFSPVAPHPLVMSAAEAEPDSPAGPNRASPMTPRISNGWRIAFRIAFLLFR